MQVNTTWYGAHGDPVYSSENGVSCPIRYAGYYYDADTRNYYLKNRYYNSYSGRFLTEDPYWNVSNMLYGKFADSVEERVYYPAVAQSLNRYLYCAGNPGMYTDPMGLVITAWDKAHCTDEELYWLNIFTEQWENAYEQGDQALMDSSHQSAEAIRNQYRDTLNGEHGFDDGNTGLNGTKYSQDFWFEGEIYPGSDFKEEHPAILPNNDYVALAVGIGCLDSPAPGPMDIAAGAVLAVGVVGTAILAENSLEQTAIPACTPTFYDVVFSKGKSNPKDLEKGMSARQKGMFQRAIENEKKSNGMPPNYNLPWEVLVALAKEIVDTYK